MKILDNRSKKDIVNLKDLSMGNVFEVLYDEVLGGKYFLYGDGKMVNLSSGKFYYPTLFINKTLRRLNTHIEIDN